jgi:SAM-dependent methyltransferase
MFRQYTTVENRKENFMSYVDSVKNHYIGEAIAHGKALESTMPDSVVRAKELEAIQRTLELISKEGNAPRILEIGCGNGTLLEQLFKAGYRDVVGIDFLPEFVELAKSRSLGFDIRVADVKDLPFSNAEFDVIVGERVIINLKDREHQRQAFQQLRRVLKPGGYLVMIEAFEDAWHNLNAARTELGLFPIPMASQNRWFQRGELEFFIEGIFTPVTQIAGQVLTPRNFLSSHYFISRVVHALLLEIRKNCPDCFNGEVRNSHFTQFFGTLLPPHGSYAPVQFLCFKAI